MHVFARVAQLTTPARIVVHNTQLRNRRVGSRTFWQCTAVLCKRRCTVDALGGWGGCTDVLARIVHSGHAGTITYSALIIHSLHNFIFLFYAKSCSEWTFLVPACLFDFNWPTISVIYTNVFYTLSCSMGRWRRTVMEFKISWWRSDGWADFLFFLFTSPSSCTF